MSSKTRQARHDLGTRVQALSLLEAGIPVAQITALTHIAKSTVYEIRKTAVSRGYDPVISKMILLDYVKDGARSGRPTKSTEGVAGSGAVEAFESSDTRQV